MNWNSLLAVHESGSQYLPFAIIASCTKSNCSQRGIGGAIVPDCVEAIAPARHGRIGVGPIRTDRPCQVGMLGALVPYFTAISHGKIVWCSSWPEGR
jgi:hypothetical protein